MIVLQPQKRRLVYTVFYEALAIALSGPLLWWLGGGEALGSLALAALISAIAMIWNYSFNAMYEAWERRRHLKFRSVRARWIHASLFEIGLIAATLPLYMWWYDVELWRALQMEAALLAFFFFFTFAFTWAFDQVFELPGKGYGSEGTR